MAWFGFQIPGFNHDPAVMFERTADLAVAAEDSGWHSVWVMDHFWQLPPLGGPDAPILEGYTLLGGLAARTSRVQLGTLVTGVTYRNPALVAKLTTTLDVMSGGRAICGIGGAWYEPEHIGYGYGFPPARERLDRLEEAVQICRAMFDEEKPSFKGAYYEIAEARNVPRPLRRIPIMVGGSGPKRTLRIVAQYADMANFSGDVETMKQKIGILHGHCETVGRDPSTVEVTRLGTLALTNSAEESRAITDMITAAAGAEAVKGYNIGTEDEIVEQVAALIDAGVDGFTFNMPLSPIEAVSRAGELFTKHFG